MMADINISRLAAMRPKRKLRRVPSTNVDQAIGDGLRSVFHELPDPKLPDDWMTLLERLDRVKSFPDH